MAEHSVCCIALRSAPYFENAHFTNLKNAKNRQFITNFKTWNNFYIFVYLFLRLHFENFLRLLLNIMSNQRDCLLKKKSIFQAYS